MGDKQVLQRWYHCRTCFKDKQYCCYACSLECHKDHDVLVIDKGGDKSGKIQRKVSSKCNCDPKTCYYKTYQYECHTCWGRDSKYNKCCNFCIKNFHSHHQYSKHIVLREDISCSCDKYKHKYNPMQAKGCSYDLLNNLSYPSPGQYECHTCWGKDSNLRCCKLVISALKIVIVIINIQNM